jgi:predicted transcriptional regulator
MTFGKTNLSSVKGVNTEEILKKQEKFRDMIQQVKRSGINIDLIISNILMDFRMETENTTKEFYKVSKKQNL